MKKLLLLSLIFAALVFQSCKKISSDIGEEDLVPIVFSQAGITGTKTGATPVLIKTLVLGTLGTSVAPVAQEVVRTDVQKNDWTTIYHSTSIDNLDTQGPLADRTKHYAIGDIELLYNDASTSPVASDKTFDPIVAYPLDDLTEIYIKAFVPFDAIVDGSTLISSINNGELTSFPPTVTFDIKTGRDDIRATKPIVTTGSNQSPQGIGSGKIPTVDLVFDHLLTKINFLIVADDILARAYWGKFVSVTLIGGNTKFTCNLSDNVTTALTTDINTLGFTTEPIIKEIPLSSDTDDQKQACSLMIYPEKDPITYQIIVNTIRPKQDGSNETETVQSEKLDILTDKQLTEGGQHDVTITFKENKEIKLIVKQTPWIEKDIVGGGKI